MASHVDGMHGTGAAQHASGTKQDSRSLVKHTYHNHTTAICAGPPECRQAIARVSDTVLIGAQVPYASI